MAAQGHTNEAIATLLDSTEGTIKTRRQRIRTWLTALAERADVADLVEAWDKSGSNQRRAVAIRCTYPGRRKAEAGLAWSVDQAGERQVGHLNNSGARFFLPAVRTYPILQPSIPAGIHRKQVVIHFSMLRWIRHVAALPHKGARRDPARIQR